MSPLSWPVVIGTLLVGSPALWAAQVEHTLSLDVALERLLICALAVWVVASLIVEVTRAATRSNAGHHETDETHPP